MRSTRRHDARRWAKPLAATVSAALALTLLQAVPALGDDDTREQRRPKTQDVTSTPVVEADGPRTPLKHLTGYGATPRPKAAWPEPGSATVTLGASGASGAARKGLRAGGLPVRLAPPSRGPRRPPGPRSTSSATPQRARPASTACS